MLTIWDLLSLLVPKFCAAIVLFQMCFNSPTTSLFKPPSSPLVTPLCNYPLRTNLEPWLYQQFFQNLKHDLFGNYSPVFPPSSSNKKLTIRNNTGTVPDNGSDFMSPTMTLTVINLVFTIYFVFDNDADCVNDKNGDHGKKKKGNDNRNSCFAKEYIHLF